MAITDYNYPNIEPTDYIDESLDKIIARDNASKCGFRRVDSFPIVTEENIGMKVYLNGRGNFQLITVDPEPYWKQLTTDNRNPAYIDWVQENYQPISALLTSLARLTQAANALPYFDGPNDMQATALSETARTMLAQSDAAGIRSTLGLGNVSTLNLPLDGSTAIAPGSIPVTAIDANFRRSMGWSTGDIKLTYKLSADDGWVMANDGSIGNQASGATTRANSDTRDLFYLMWNLPVCEVQTFAGNPSTKTTAAGDWSANKRLVLPKVLGRVLGATGSGEGLTTRDLGGSLGVESFNLDASNVPPHFHGGLRPTVNAGYDNFMTLFDGNGFSTKDNSWGTMHGYRAEAGNTAPDLTAISDKAGNIVNSSDNPSGQTAINNMQPTSFVNVMIKL